MAIDNSISSTCVTVLAGLEWIVSVEWFGGDMVQLLILRRIQSLPYYRPDGVFRINTSSIIR